MQISSGKSCIYAESKKTSIIIEFNPCCLPKTEMTNRSYILWNLNVHKMLLYDNSSKWSLILSMYKNCTFENHAIVNFMLPYYFFWYKITICNSTIWIYSLNIFIFDNMKNKIEGTPILKIVMVKKLYVKIFSKKFTPKNHHRYKFAHEENDDHFGSQ